jgi:hypothetical protein
MLFPRNLVTTLLKAIQATLSNSVNVRRKAQRKRLLLFLPLTNWEIFAKVLDNISSFWQSFNKLFYYAQFNMKGWQQCFLRIDRTFAQNDVFNQTHHRYNKNSFVQNKVNVKKCESIDCKPCA